MAKIVDCEYLHAHEYRRFANLMISAGFALHKGLWWVERICDGSAVTYRLYHGLTSLGCVSREDLGDRGMHDALWELMKYLERHCSCGDMCVFVFPADLDHTNWSSKSHEFIILNGSSAKRELVRFYKEVFSIRRVGGCV
jgi:hypothetical protein